MFIFGFLCNKGPQITFSTLDPWVSRSVCFAIFTATFFIEFQSFSSCKGSGTIFSLNMVLMKMCS